MEATTSYIKMFEDRLLNLDESITNYEKKNLNVTIGEVQEKALAQDQDQDFEPISRELIAYSFDCNKKFDELHLKLKNKEIDKEEIPKLKEQLIQMHKTMNSFASHVSSDPQKTFHSGKEKLVGTLSAQLELLADDILNNYVRLPVVCLDNPQEVFDLPYPPVYELSKIFSGDPGSPPEIPSIEQLKMIPPMVTEPLKIYSTREWLFLIPACEWFDKNQEGIGDKALRSDNFKILLEYAYSTGNTVLRDQCEAFAVASLKETSNDQKKTIAGEKWLEYGSLLTRVDLPQLKQACIDTLPYVKLDLTKPEERSRLKEIGILIKELNLPNFSDESYYPPIKFIPTDSDEIKKVDFVKLLHFSGTFQILMEDLNYEYSKTDILKSFATTEQIETLVEWMDEGMKSHNRGFISSLIKEENWKDLLQLANYWDIKELKGQCEQFAIEEINRDKYPDVKYTKDELKEMIILAKRTDSVRLLDALMGKWKA